MNRGLNRKLDYSDYAGIPADGKRYEILEGDLFEIPTPSPYHQRASKRLQRQLEQYFEARSIGEVFDAPIDVILTAHDIVQPDLVVVSREEQISKRGVEGAPLLLVEILSPSTRDQDRGVKSRRYAASGVPHYWLVDLDAQLLECYALQSGEYRLVVKSASDSPFSHPSWPDLKLDLAALWR